MLIAQQNFLDLGQKQAQLFLASNMVYCEVLVTCNCPRQLLVMSYNQLVRQGKLIAIEDLRLQDKEAAWQTAKDIAKGRLGRKALIEVVQALLAIEYFLNL